MSALPKVVASSVVRSAQQGESHGGVYIVDLEAGSFEQVIDWNDKSISWEGRGSDRGLRGIAFYEDEVYLAASDEIFVFDRDFAPRGSLANRYLKHCHETHIANGMLFLTSTGFNSILEFDLAARKFVRGHTITPARQRKAGWSRWLFGRTKARAEYGVAAFEPNSGQGPVSDGSLHMNNVTVHNDAIMVSGTRTDALFAIQNGGISRYGPLPRGTHNAAAFKDGVIYNDTASDRIVIADRANGNQRLFAVPKFSAAELTHTDIPNDHARQGFARGLCRHGDDLLIGGSSPSTISVYRISTGERVKSVNISKDIRNCIHGLEIWPW